MQYRYKKEKRPTEFDTSYNRKKKQTNENPDYQTIQFNYCI